MNLPPACKPQHYLACGYGLVACTREGMNPNGHPSRFRALKTGHDGL